MIVWWTIPNSSVAWEWRPEDSVYVAGVLVRDGDGGWSLVPEVTTPHPWPESQPPTGQALAEMTATFGLEANVRPVDMTVTWIYGGTAVSWDRCLDLWLRHEVGTRHGRRHVRPGTPLPGVPIPDSVEAAGATALELLGDALGNRP